MKRWRGIIIAVVVAVMGILLVTVVFADETCQCLTGTNLVAKFEWNGTAYVFKKPTGNEGVVVVTGNAISGTWESTVAISNLVMKGGLNCYTYQYTPPVTTGTFSNTVLPLNLGGQIPEISNLQFCEGEPTSVTVTGFSARNLDTPWYLRCLHWLKRLLLLQ